MRGPDYGEGMRIIREREQADSATRDINVLNGGYVAKRKRFADIRYVLGYDPAARYVYGASQPLVEQAFNEALSRELQPDGRFPHLEALNADRARRRGR